jgi:predicted transcriptional regulator
MEDFVKKLPEDASRHEFAREIALLAGIQTAREEAERGDGVPADKAFQLIDKWVSE